VPTFRALDLAGLYEGVDVELRVGQHDGRSRVEYDVVLAPGADLAQAVVKVEGAESMCIGADGSLEIATAAGALRQVLPAAWQERADGLRECVPARFRVLENMRFGFEADGVEPGATLVVDPLLIHSTYAGGMNCEMAFGVDAEPAGDVVAVGLSQSSNYPTTPGAFDPVWNGDALICGITASNDFPVTPGAFDTSLGGPSDAFALRLAAGGATSPWATFVGGIDDEVGLSVSLFGPAEQVVLGGSTFSRDFPTTAGALDTTLDGLVDGFVTRLSGDGSSLLQSTYLGGSVEDAITSVDVHIGGDVFVAGITNSADFPTTAGALDTTLNGSSDGFVARIKPNLAALTYSTYVGGNDRDELNGVVADPNGIAFFVGTTYSTDMIVTGAGFVQPAQGGPAGTSDVYLGMLDESGAFLEYGTYVGGPPSEHGLALTLDFLSYIAFFAGHARDGFPTTAGAYQTAFAGGSGDFFVLRLDPRPCPNPAAAALKAQGCGGYTLTTSLPIMGSLMNMTVQGPPTTLGVLYVSTAGGPNFMFENCEIGLNLALWSALLVFNTNASGTWTTQIPVFNDPPRCGQQIFFQAGLFSPTVGPAFFGGLTNGVLLTEGS
jgi:hypothetical protein